MINSLSPILAGKLQVSTTSIKLIPLIFLAVIGVIYGIVNGQIIENFHFIADVAKTTTTNPLLTSVVATAFAYEGWIIATSINSEIKISKVALLRALVLGSIVVVTVYVAYFIGLAGVMPTSELMTGGEGAVRLAFEKILGSAGGSLLFVIIVISCFGTLNGLMLGCIRGLYSLVSRDM